MWLLNMCYAIHCERYWRLSYRCNIFVSVRVESKSNIYNLKPVTWYLYFSDVLFL